MYVDLWADSDLPAPVDWNLLVPCSAVVERRRIVVGIVHVFVAEIFVGHVTKHLDVAVVVAAAAVIVFVLVVVFVELILLILSRCSPACQSRVAVDLHHCYLVPLILSHPVSGHSNDCGHHLDTTPVE